MSERLRGLSLLMVRLAVIAPKFAFVESFELILQNAQDLRHIVTDFLQVAVDRCEFSFQTNVGGCCCCHHYYGVMLVIINFSVVKNKVAPKRNHDKRLNHRMLLVSRSHV